MYDRVAYFAYHREDERIVVGFYFAAATGQATAAFEMWRSFIGAWPDRVKASPLDLRALDARAASPSAEEREPSLADFCAEALEIAEGEGLDAAAALRPVLAALRTTMSDAWR